METNLVVWSLFSSSFHSNPVFALLFQALFFALHYQQIFSNNILNLHFNADS